MIETKLNELIMKNEATIISIPSVEDFRQFGNIFLIKMSVNSILIQLLDRNINNVQHKYVWQYT